MPVPLYQIDAFTDKPFGGNPAAVCLLEAEVEETWMQAVAAEMNLSETAFVRKRGVTWELRWFTPAAEVELCGHATLAAAHLLWELGKVDPAEAMAFSTRFSGVLTCRRGEDGIIGMDFPADVPNEEDTAEAGLLDALGVTAVNVARGKYDWIIEVGDEAQVRQVEPDFALLRQFDTRGIIVTARSNADDIDIVSRFFAPRLRVEEDPVTGSAHCVLGPYWAVRLGTQVIEAYQASKRGGRLRVTVQGKRVELAGRAVTVMRAELLV